MAKDEAGSNHQYLFSKKDTLQERSSSLSRKETRKVSTCKRRLDTPDQLGLGSGCEKETVPKLQWTFLEHQDLDYSNLKQAGELCQRLADEICGIVGPGTTTKAGKKWAAINSGCKGNGATYRKLEELLKTLHGEADKEHAGLVQHLWEEVELEKSYFLCHLLKVHGHTSLAVEEKKDEVTKGPAKCRSEDSKGKSISESFKHRKQFFTHYYPKHQSMKKNKQEDSGKSTLSSYLVEEKTNKGDHYHTLPDEGWDLQSSGPSLEKFSPSRYSQEIIEDMVSSGILPAFLKGWLLSNKTVSYCEMLCVESFCVVHET